MDIFKDGNMDLDNNEAKRQSKNFFFARNDNGAKTGRILLAIIDLAWTNNIELSIELRRLKHALNNIS